MNKVAKKAIIRNGEIIYGDDIEGTTSKPNELSARHNREAMKVQHRKDMLQRNQIDYYKAYKDQAKNLNPETRRLLS